MCVCLIVIKKHCEGESMCVYCEQTNANKPEGTLLFNVSRTHHTFFLCRHQIFWATLIFLETIVKYGMHGTLRFWFWLVLKYNPESSRWLMILRRDLQELVLRLFSRPLSSTTRPLMLHSNVDRVLYFFWLKMFKVWAFRSFGSN